MDGKCEVMRGRLKCISNENLLDISYGGAVRKEDARRAKRTGCEANGNN